MKDVSIIVPSYERPQRTRRAIQAILDQKFTGTWQALVVGDKCPAIDEMLQSGEASTFMEQAKHQGNSMAIFNLPIHYGGWGYQCRITGIRLSYTNYTVFMDNDDVILPNHLQSYYDAISGTENDFMALCTKLEPIENAGAPNGRIRVPEMENGKVGYQELIVKSSFLKRMPPQEPIYNADWHLVQNMINAAAKFEIVTDNTPTHIIMGVGELREKNID